MKNTIYTFIKFGIKEHLERLYMRGEVYLNTWTYFKKLEENIVQGDKDEGLRSLYQVSKGARVYIKPNDGEFKEIEGLCGQIKTGYGRSMDQYNLFCMFSLTKESYDHLGDKLLPDFGDTAVVMTHGDEFIRRLENKLSDLRFEHQKQLVSYVDNGSHHGHMGPFKKMSSYSYQSELRFLVHTGLHKPLMVEIGSIKDISVIVPAVELKERIRFDI